MDENSIMLTHFNNTEYKVCLEVLSKYCEYWNVFNNGSLSQNMLGWIGWMVVKFHPEVKKSMSRFHCPVFSRSDLVIIKIASALSTKPGVQKLPANFWQLKSVHSLAIRVGEIQAMVSRGYKPRQTKNNHHHHHQRMNLFHFPYTFQFCIKWILKNFQPLEFSLERELELNIETTVW